MPRVNFFECITAGKTGASGKYSGILCSGENRNLLLIATGYTGALEDIEDSKSASSFQRRVAAAALTAALTSQWLKWPAHSLLAG